MSVSNIGDHHVPVVVADLSGPGNIRREDLQAIGYSYDPALDKWNIGDAAADYLYTGNRPVDFELPGYAKGLSPWITADRRISRSADTGGRPSFCIA